MIKRYFNTFFKVFFFTTLPMILIGIAVYRRADYRVPYVWITIGTIFIALIIALAIRVFRSEKGKGYVNAILGYIIIIPALFVLRFMFGSYLFRRASELYILIAIVGVIYGIALLVASRKYKSEVSELNRLLLNKEVREENEEKNE